MKSVSVKRSLHYDYVDSCPLCGGNGASLGSLARGNYRFGNFTVPYPNEGRTNIPIVQCDRCGLVYKGYVPTRSDLKDLLKDCSAEVWKQHLFSYARERALLTDLLGNREQIAILDVGSGAGDWLAVCSGRAHLKSALDVVMNSRCADQVTGEYLLGYVDDELGDPRYRYDVVTAFDVLEHFYDPRSAFTNLSKLLTKDGFLVAETGAAEGATEVKEWWYLNLLEHHICWSAKALHFAAKEFGLSLMSLRATRHKGRRYMALWKQIAVLCMHMTRRPEVLRAGVTRLTGIDPSMVGNPLVADHWLAVFKKIP